MVLVLHHRISTFGPNMLGDSKTDRMILEEAAVSFPLTALHFLNLTIKTKVV
jgi:hypothetical protein